MDAGNAWLAKAYPWLGIAPVNTEDCPTCETHGDCEHGVCACEHCRTDPMED
jgi:hypothetical protein